MFLADAWARMTIAQTSLYDSLYLIIPAATAILCIPALISLAGFGGSSRNGVAVIASGLYLLLAGILFYSPFLLPYGAGSNDVFMGNLLLSPLYMGGGLLVALIGARASGRVGRRERLLRATGLALIGAAFLAALYLLFGQRYHDAYGVASPPYLEPLIMGLTLLLGIGVWAGGRIWQDRASNRSGGNNRHVVAS
jgi:hypothetical protein